MAAGCVVALLPGAIELRLLGPISRASGAIAAVVLVFYIGNRVATEDTSVQNLKSTLESPQATGIDPASDVYVVINKRLAAYSRGHQSAPPLNFGDRIWHGEKTASILRGPGGIQVGYGGVAQGDLIQIVALDANGQWWRSHDITVPEGETPMNAQEEKTVKAEFLP